MERITVIMIALAVLSILSLIVFVATNPLAAMAKKSKSSDSSGSNSNNKDSDKATDNPTTDNDKTTDSDHDVLKATDNSIPSTTTTTPQQQTTTSSGTGYPGLDLQGQTVDLSKNNAILPTISSSGSNSGSHSTSTSSSSGSKHITKDSDEDDLITSTPNLDRFNVVEMTNATNIKNPKMLRISFENSTDRFVVYVPSAAGHYNNGTIIMHSVLQPHGDNINTNTIVSSSSNVKTTAGASLQQLARDCALTPSLSQCKSDSAGNCPSGFSHNVNNQCIPDKCPKGYQRHDNDETGQCFAKTIKGPLGRVSKALNNLIGSG